MSIEQQAPCEIQNTICQKRVQERIRLSPCWLKAANQCRPLNMYYSNVESGMHPQIAEVEMQLDAHILCPFTVDALYRPDGIENADMHSLFNQVESGKLDLEDENRFRQMVIHDLKNGDIENPLISPKK